MEIPNRQGVESTRQMFLNETHNTNINRWLAKIWEKEFQV